MRIIGGMARGRKLFAPAGDNTRPTSDRVREALFNIISMHVRGARVLDLFGGSGALTLEAMSRGAESAVVNDMNGAAVSVIRRNAQAVLGDEQDDLKITCRDYKALIRDLTGKFDLVFLDPPYRMESAYADAVTLLAKQDLLAEDALIVMEQTASAQIPVPEGFEAYDERKYGETKLLFVRRAGE